MNDQATPAADSVLTRRIYREYLEMPDLQITCRQAQRLFGLTERTCAKVLDDLVEQQFLVRTPGGLYRRLTEGTPGVASLRIGRTINA